MKKLTTNEKNKISDVLLFFNYLFIANMKQFAFHL
jgi:hypothetical protein